MANLSRLTAQFDRVLINGDAVDRFEGEEHRDPVAPLVERLKKALACRSGPPEWITGNHDPLISDAHCAYLEEPALLVFHGDYILDCASPWLPSVHDFRARYHAAIRAHPQGAAFGVRAALFRRLQIELRPERFESYGRYGAFFHVLRQGVRPLRAWRIFEYVWSSPPRVAELAATYERPVRRVAFGHTHRPGCWQIGALRLYNTGSFMPFSRSYPVVVEGQEVRQVALGRLLDGLGAQVALTAPG